MRKVSLAAVALAAMMVQGGHAGAAVPHGSGSQDCGTFFECLFGKHGPRIEKGTPRVRQTPGKSHGDVNPSAPNHSVPDRATAETIAWSDAAKYSAGSLIVRTPERRLYYVLGNGKAVRYKIGVGREGFQWSGTSRIISKQEWPEWHPPAEMIAREAAKGHHLPDMMPGGPDNPLGARAMYIGGTMFRIHGTNNPGSIGGAVSSGCIRMMNTDVSALYDKVQVGARVYVFQ